MNNRDYFSVDATHNQWFLIVSYCTIKLRFNFSDILWRYFCFQLRLILKFFFFLQCVTCCWGVLIPILYSVGTAKPHFTWFICCFSEENFVLFFKYFFQNLLVRHFENFQRKYFLTFFSVDLWLCCQFTRPCSIRAVTTFPLFLRCR